MDGGRRRKVRVQRPMSVNCEVNFAVADWPYSIINVVRGLARLFNAIMRDDNAILKNDNSILRNDNAVLKNDHAILRNYKSILKNDNGILRNYLYFGK